ncbi:hypothetical protein OCU04_002007 [Sclerotinia nivalis]|uniref:Heterokaryon incompatibility domain-containing protein n=1 Tax=Sclerotinia nivalis TaxID=352851 RepID=A0A9X0AZA1_9HELO|nr:hypothetical protein OCU04_002007 [Sclerotinia nivalis]
MEKQQYKYSPLLEPDAIRVIIIQPSSLISSPLSCSLIHSTLFHYNESLLDYYTALSYVWGDANDRRTILVDGKSMSITASLDSSLRHLRDTQKDIVIWADGICINQFDNEEKNKQVALMGLIYEIARHTIIFLGETTTQTDEIFELFDSPTSVLTRQIGSGFLSNARHSSNYETVHLRTEKHTGRKLENLIHHVSNMPWFRRVWVLQELVLSGDPWVQVGSHRLRWKSFTSLILNNNTLQNHALVQSPYYKLLSDMEEIRNTFISGEISKSKDPLGYLLRILHSRRGHGVLDPRDMIYGHSALFKLQSSNPEIEGLIKIDYRKSVSEIYTDLALYLLNKKYGFELLSHVENVKLEVRRHGLPSWVPDWTSMDVSPEARFRFGTITGKRDINPVYLALSQPAVLRCIGTRVNVIEIIKDGIPPIDDILALCQKIKDLLLQDNEVSFDEGLTRRYDQGSRYTEEQKKNTFSIIYKYLCSWIGSDYLADKRQAFLQWMDIEFYPCDRRMEQISNEVDFRRLPPMKSYT